MITRYLLCVLSASALALAAFKPSTYVARTFELLKQNLTERGAVNWALPPHDIFSQGPEKNISVHFFRASVQGLEVLAVQEDCSMTNMTGIVEIECLVKSPSVKLKAHGNMKDVLRPLMSITAVVNDLLSTLKIQTKNGTTDTSFEVKTTIHLDYELSTNIRPSEWSEGIQIQLRKWVQWKITEFVRDDIKPTLSYVVSRTPWP